MIKWAEPDHSWAFRAWTVLQQYMYRLRLSLDLLLSSYNEVHYCKKGAESSRCLCCSVGKHHSWVVSRSDTWRESVLPHDAWHKTLCFVKQEAGRLIFRRHGKSGDVPRVGWKVNQCSVWCLNSFTEQEDKLNIDLIPSEIILQVSGSLQGRAEILIQQKPADWINTATTGPPAKPLQFVVNHRNLYRHVSLVSLCQIFGCSVT